MKTKGEAGLSPLQLLGLRMISARKKHGYNSADVARLMGVTRQSVSNWELGKSQPKMDKLVEFCALMGDIGLSDLMRGVSIDLGDDDVVMQRQRAASAILPIFSSEQSAGAWCDSREKGKQGRAARFLSVDKSYKPSDFGFVVTGRSMTERFRIGDEVIIRRSPVAEPGQYVFARVNGQYVFRRYAPVDPNSSLGASLIALNSLFPSLTMGDDDEIIGVMGAQITTSHD